MNDNQQRSTRPFPIASDDIIDATPSKSADIEPKRTHHSFSTVLIVLSAPLLITGLALGWFDHHALGYFSVLFIAICFGLLGFFALVALGSGRKRG